MTFKKHIPNLITLLNLLSGTIAVFFAVKEQLVLAGLFVFLGIFFDFFDGLTARLLNVQGELGKQLDSLADVVTSGVVPGIILFQLISYSLIKNGWSTGSKFITEFITKDYFNSTFFIALIGLIFTLASAYRLAKFNIDERQSSSFIGLPTPAATLVVISLPFILEYSTSGLAHNLIGSTWFLIILTLLLTYFMNAEIPLFSLKFNDFTWKNNKIKFIFLALTVITTVIFKFLAIPLVIVLYVLLSLISRK
jgi:CDP-diacylglycerol--serine O-phosphatidyltransferase